MRIFYQFRHFFFSIGTGGFGVLQSIFSPEFFLSIWEWFKEAPILALFEIITVFALFEASIQFIRWRHFENLAKNFVHMKIILPREDSKKDHEEKTEKDFKEKIAVMQQLFRAVYEISDLNLRNIIRTAFWQNDQVSFELIAEDKELSFYVVCSPYYQTIIEKQITTFYTSAEVSIQKAKRFRPRKYVTNGFAFFQKNGRLWPIRMYDAMESDPLNDIANVLSKLEEDEHAAIQLVIHPISDSWRKEAKKTGTRFYQRKRATWIDKIPIIKSIPIISHFFRLLSWGIHGGGGGKTNEPGASSGDSFIRMLQPEEEKAKHMGEKAAESGFECAIRMLASAKTHKKVEDILNNLSSAFTVFKDANTNWFENRRILPINSINSLLILHAFHKRLVHFWHKTSLFTPKELATIFHFPDAKYNKIPTIKWLKYKVLPPPVDLPKEGMLLGNNNFRGMNTPVYIKEHDRSRHFYVIGKSGSGKSALLSWMARQDAQNGNGFCVVDPHGDLVDDVLQYVPKSRVKDVVYFNPADTERPMGLNMLEANTSEEKDRASLDAMEIFIKLFGNEIFGPRLQHYFRNGALTLMDDDEEGATLLDIPRLFVDEEFQKKKVSKVKNHVVRSFWEHEIAKTGQREKEEMIPYLSAKFGPFLTNTTMRNIIGQTSSAFNVRKIMDEGKILLVNLSKGKIGDINAQLLGLVFVNKIAQAAMSRADIPEEERRPFYLYVDEFQNFATDTFADILSEARKYKLALIMAHQYISQLQEGQGGIKIDQKESPVKAAVFGNVGTMMSFKIGAEDAEYFEKEYAPYLSAQDIIGIANYKAYLKLNIDNATSRPFSLGTIWDTSDRRKDVAEIAKEYSRLKYTREKTFVDKEIEERIGINTSENEEDSD